MLKKENQKTSKGKLLAEIERLKKELKKKKKYGLVWEDKPEDVVEMCKEKLPVLKEVKSKKIITDKNKPVNLLIEGDNYHSLSVLNYTHKGKIDVIYIDPPYNTGKADEWKYNDKYVDENDGYKHSKWLNMMNKRLRLSKNLLKLNGVVFISIDDNEQAPLKMLCDEIFSENNFVFQFVIDKTAQGANQSVTFKQTHEYCLLYTKGDQNMIDSDIETDVDGKKYKYRDERGLYAITNSFDSINSPLSSNKNRGYTVYYNEKTGGAEIRDEYKRKNGTFSDFDKILIKKGFVPIRPGIRKGIQYPWNWTSARFLVDYKKELVFMKNKKGELNIYHKNRATGKTKDTTLKRFDTRNFGNQLLVDILGEKKFDYPKSLDMIKWVISKHKNKSAIVLDFFAGSGTTGQAVLEINKIDVGNRQFILCTNNENNICTDVCYPRIEKVINGYKNTKKENIAGLGGNLKYFKTGFVDYKESTDRNKVKLTKEAVEMLCIKEGTYESVLDNKDFKIFKNHDHYTGIIFDQLAIEDFKKAIKGIKGKISVYVFSLGDEDFSEEFADLIKQKAKSRTERSSGAWIQLSPIPEAILRVYRRIFK